MPAARKLAAEKGVDLSSDRRQRPRRARHQGGRGRAARAPRCRACDPPPSPVDIARLLGDRPEQRVPMSRLRQRVAERLVQSQSDRCDPDDLQRSQHAGRSWTCARSTRSGSRRSTACGSGFMSFFVKASVHALKKFPVVNASVDGTDIVYHGYFDIGIAVASPRGLVVPDHPQRRPALARGHREADRRLRQARPGGQAHDRGADRRHLLDLQRRGVRLDAVHPDPQPAAERDPRRPRHQRPGGGGERPDRGPAR